MKNFSKNVKKITAAAILFAICVIFAGALFGSEIAFAQGGAGLNYVPLAPLPGIGDTGPVTNLPQYINNMVKLLIGVAAALAVIMIVIGGLERMTSDSIQKQSDGRKKIEQALLGLLLALGSWLILNTIDPALLKNDLSIDVTPVATNTTAVPPPVYSEVKYTVPSEGSDTNQIICIPHSDKKACEDRHSLLMSQYTSMGYQNLSISCVDQCTPNQSSTVWQIRVAHKKKTVPPPEQWTISCIRSYSTIQSCETALDGRAWEINFPPQQYWISIHECKLSSQCQTYTPPN